MPGEEVVTVLRELKARVEKYQQLKAKWGEFGEKVENWERRIFACQTRETWTPVEVCLKSANQKLDQLDDTKGKWYTLKRVLKIGLNFHNAEDYIETLEKIEDDIEFAITNALIDETQVLTRQIRVLNEEYEVLASQPRGFVFPELAHGLVSFRRQTFMEIAHKLGEGASNYGIIGDGGAGKSYMMQLIRNCDEVQTRYDDRIRYYNRAREHLLSKEFVAAHLVDALEEFGINVKGCSGIKDAVKKVNTKLKAKPDEPYLFLVDDVWTDEEVEHFLNLVQGTTSSMVYTSRKPRGLPSSATCNTVHISKSLVAEEEESAIYEFAAMLSGCAVDSEESKSIVMAIARGLEFFPFNMQVIFKSCRSVGIESWKEAKVMLEDRKYDESPIETALEIFMKSDKSNLILMLFRFAVLPHGSIRFNNHDAMLMLGVESIAKAQETMKLLSSCCAVTKLSDDAYAVHDLYVDYLQSETAQRKFLQKRLNMEDLEKALLSAFFKKSTSDEFDLFYTTYVQTRLEYLVYKVVSKAKLTTKARREFADPALSKQLNNIGRYYRRKAAYSEALPLLQTAVATARVGHRQSITLRLCAQLKVRRFFERRNVVQQRFSTEDAPPLTIYITSLAQCLQDMGRYGNAEELFVECKRLRRILLGRRHPMYANSLNNLAVLLEDQGRFDEAKPLYEEAIALWKKVYGDEHLNVAYGLNNLASLLQKQGKLDEAEPLHKQSLDIRRKKLTNEHEDVATSLHNLALLLRDKGEYVQAEKLQREALAIREKVLGKEHPLYASTLAHLALSLQHQGKMDEAEPMFSQALEIRRKVYGNEHPYVAISLHNLALFLLEKDKNSEQALEIGNEALRVAELTLGNDHPRTQLYRKSWG